MTAKELLYVEDVLGHAEYFRTQCRETASSLRDPELRRCVEDLEKSNDQIFQSFYGLL